MAVARGTAAEIKLTPAGECPVTLTGPIIPGDADRLKITLQRANLENLYLEEATDGKNSICLDSTGGAYLEGLIIGQIVFKNGIGTRITSGSRCYSACALIFMSGRIRGNESEGTYRYLHVNADLGFHAPYLSLSEGLKFTTSGVEAIFDVANRMASLFIQLYSYRPAFSERPWISTSLIAEMYATSRDDLIRVDTIDKSERWNISLYGYTPTRLASDRSLVQACQNFQNWSADKKSEEVSAGTLQMHLGKLKKDKNGFVRIDFSGLADLYCQIKVSTSGYELCSTNGLSGISHGKCPEYGLFQNFVIGLPPQTNIRRLTIK